MDTLNSQYIQKELTNGSKLIHIKVPQVPYGVVSVWFRAGSRFDPKEKHGLAHFFEHIYGIKTLKHPDRVARISMLESKGIDFNAFTGFESAHYYQTQLPEYTLFSFEHLLDGIYNSVFNEKDVEDEKEVIINEEARNRENPSDYMWRLVHKSLWPKSSLSSDLLGDKESIESISLDDIKEFKKRYYTPANSVIVVVSDLETTEIEVLLQKNDACPKPAQIKFKEEVFNDPIPIFIDRRDTELIEVSIAFRTSTNKQIGESVALDLLSEHMGGNFSSRLIERMRIKESLTYWVNATTQNYSDTGYFSISYSVSKKNLQKTVDIVIEEIKKIQEKELSEERLQTLKNIYLTNHIKTHNDPLEMAAWFGFPAIADGEILGLEEFRKKVENVKKEDLLNVSRKYFKVENRSIVLIGDIKEKELLI